MRKVTVVVALDLGCGNTKNSEYESKCTTKFTIKVNARTISADATNFNNFAKSTVTHEFGHVFWLCDNPNTSKSSIMKYSRNSGMTAPQTFDVDNVNAKYD